MTVKELIKLLETYPENLDIVYSCCSEYTTLIPEEIMVQKLKERRADGWVHSKFSRSDNTPLIDYLTFPGN